MVITETKEEANKLLENLSEWAWQIPNWEELELIKSNDQNKFHKLINEGYKLSITCGEVLDNDLLVFIGKKKDETYASLDLVEVAFWLTEDL